MLTIFMDTLLQTCKHEQRAHGLQSIGLTCNKHRMRDTHWPCQLIRNIRSEDSFLPILTDSSYLRVAQMPRYGNWAIFVTMTETDGQTKLIAYPLYMCTG